MPRKLKAESSKSDQLLTLEEAPSKKEQKSVDPRIYDSRGRSIAWRIRDTYRIYAARTQHLISGGEATIGHWFYLRILTEHDGLSQRELSELAGIHPNTAVPALESMERNGLVTRIRDPKDRRRFCIHLTEYGRSFRDELAPAIQDLLSNSVKGISNEELDVFFGALDKILENLSDDDSSTNISWVW